jgi:hypothetical protein
MVVTQLVSHMTLKRRRMDRARGIRKFVGSSKQSQEQVEMQKCQQQQQQMMIW